MYFLQVTIAVCMILIAMSEGLSFQQKILRSLHNNPAIFTAITKGLHTPKSKTLMAYHFHSSTNIFLKRLKLKKISKNRCRVISRSSQFKINMKFHGFLSREK